MVEVPQAQLPRYGVEVQRPFYWHQLSGPVHVGGQCWSGEPMCAPATTSSRGMMVGGS